MVALLGVAPQGDTGPLPRTLPAVLLRIRGPRGKLGLESSARSSLPSLKSLGEESSLPNRPVPAGDPRPLIESLVCWRRVLGLLDEGEERANAFELAPYDTEGFRPFDP
jgi:hypothetical protein